MNILGISCFYHDSAATLLKDGEFVAAAEEERFSRKKHDHSFPTSAIHYCLNEGGITLDDVDYIVFHEKPFIKFERLIQTYLATWPRSFWSFVKAIPLWLNQKLWVSEIIKKELGYKGEVLFSEHHMSHAASAFLLSPFEEAAILTVDGVGEWATTTKGYGKGIEIHRTAELHFPHSLGLLYSTFTAFLGFKVNEGEYKVMGMAVYGEPKYKDRIMQMIDVKEDGSFHLDMSYFAYHRSIKKSFSRKLIAEFGKQRVPESEFNLNEKESIYYADIAASIQAVAEELLVRMAQRLHKETKMDNLCMAGGVALNCTANSRILKETGFKNIFVQPAAGDSGGALGAAAYAYNTVLGNQKRPKFDSIYLGPKYDANFVKGFLENEEIRHKEMEDEELFVHVAQALADNKVIGWYQDRMELGPRALGNRSIIANPRSKDMQNIINEKIKHREKFRPFAPSVMEEHSRDYFDFEHDAPYMLFIADVHKHKLDEIPATSHLGTARIQKVHPGRNPRYHKLISEFHKLTGTPLIVNTSFNVRGEPIVCTPEDAYDTFMKTDIDMLVLGNFIIIKE